MKPTLNILRISTILLCLTFVQAEIQHKFSIHMPEKLATLYERKISLNAVTDNIVTQNTEIEAQIRDEISAIHGEISATVLPSELTRVPLYNEASPTATVIGYTEAFTPVTIVRLENGFAKLEASADKACWIRNRYILTDTIKHKLTTKQEAVRRTLEQSLGLQHMLSVERRPRAAAEYTLLGVGLGPCALELPAFGDIQEKEAL